MYVISTVDSSKHEVVIEPATAADIRKITKKRFDFNWRKTTGALTLKLVLRDTGVILGLMSITDRPEHLAIEINLLESSKENVGKGKEYANIAGCLIAYTAREAFKKGYQGYIYLMPKTDLIKHYQSIYGMTYTGLYMIVEKEDSYKLIQQYLES